MKTQRKNQRGAAMVELAISMLLIIPIFLYVLFLDDLLKFRLDQQEAVSSTLWDYSIQNYDQALPTEGTAAADKGNLTQVQKYARNTYCDHEGGIDSNGTQLITETDKNGNSHQSYVDCGGSTSSDHHKGNLSAHACWLGSGEQVTCDQPLKDVGVVGAASDYAGEFQKGGMYRCEGKLEVLNNLIPQQFFNDSFSKVDMSKKNWQGKNGDQAHQNGNSADGSNSYIFKPSEFALVTDTWALTEKQNINPEQGGKMKDRAEFAQQKNGGLVKTMYFAAKGMTYAYAAQALSKQAVIVNPNTILNVNVSIHANDPPTHSVKQDTGSRSYYDSPFMDWSGNPTQQTYNNRGNAYMGCPNPGTGC